MRIFITGATGFLGKHVVQNIHALGHDILASRLKKEKTQDNFGNIHWIYGDFTNLKFFRNELKSFNPDVVIHLAWQGIPDFSESISKINLINSINLLDFIFDNTNCKKILVSGSCWEYGKKKGACKESDPINTKSYFSWAKNSLNQYLKIKCAEREIILNWFRIFYVYGPGQRSGSLIPTLIKSFGSKEIPRLNTPMNKNDFIYVKNVASVFGEAVDVDILSGVYNLGSGYALSSYEICRIVEKQLMNTETISNKIKAKNDNTETINFWANMEKTHQSFNLIFNTSIEEGIKKHIKSMYSSKVV